MNQYGQRGRQDQRQDNQWGQGDRDRSHYGAQTGSQRGQDRSREDQQAAYQGSSFQADRDDSRGGTYGGGYGGSYGQGRDERDDYRQDYRSHGDFQSQGGYRGAHSYLTLRLLGYPRVRNYLGSWKEWGDREELPVETPHKVKG